MCPNHRVLRVLSANFPPCEWGPVCALCPLEGATEPRGGAGGWVSSRQAGVPLSRAEHTDTEPCCWRRNATSCRRGLPGIKNLVSSAARRTLSVPEEGIITTKMRLWGTWMLMAALQVTIFYIWAPMQAAVALTSAMRSAEETMRGKKQAQFSQHLNPLLFSTK